MMNYIIVFLISMVPLIELRGSIIYATGIGLPFLPAYITAIIGNMLPVPFIFLFARKILIWGADKPVIGRFFSFCLEKGEKGGKKLLIPASKIHFIMANDDYSYLHTENDRYLSTVSLAQLEAKLEPLGFFRVHRRYLVNLACVNEVDPVSGGTLLLTLSGEDEQIPVSRRRVSSLKKALGL